MNKENHQLSGSVSETRLRVEVFSDVICPWCFIGKRRLEKAVRSLNGRGRVEILWRPFELNPDMPREGMDRKAYRAAKFGSWEASEKLDSQVAVVGTVEGIPFAFDRIERTPNTFDAHRLIWLAQQEGSQDMVVEALFQGYFIEGLDIGNRETLINIAGAAGLHTERVERFLASDEDVASVREEQEKARRMGISGVPHFVINDAYALSGAQPSQTFVSLFDQAMKPTHV
jgi:predicted DsbA family dithiol-disulfide isomerase